MKYRDPKPEILRIEELVKNVKYGEIKLPRFQRPFVWKEKDVRKLFDSIYNGYPIGSILLWISSIKLASERTIGELEIEGSKDDMPTNYLLDGQQRLSSLCGALYYNGEDYNSMWKISFDLEKEEFIHPKDVFKPFYFPLNKLINTSDFINQCKVFDNQDKKSIYYERAENLLKSIKDYKIPVVRIGDMPIKEVAPIFERINSTGRKLTIIDLMRAATWKESFDLNDAIKEISEICESNNYNNIPDTHILRNIAAYFGLGIHKEEIDKLRQKNSEEIKLATTKIVNAYKAAIGFLQSQLYLETDAYIPYRMQITLLVEFFNLCQNPTNIQLKELQKWFWKTSFSKHFEGGGVGKINKDLESIRRFAKEEISKLDDAEEINYDNLINDEFKLRKASSKAFALILARNNPKSILNCLDFDKESYLKKIDSQIYFKIIKGNFQLTNNNKLKSPINFLMLNLIDNEVLSNIPSDIIFKMLKEEHEEEYSNVLKSNLLNEECINAIYENNIDGFYEIRKEIIVNEIKNIVNDSFIDKDNINDKIVDKNI